MHLVKKIMQGVLVNMRNGSFPISFAEFLSQETAAEALFEAFIWDDAEPSFEYWSEVHGKIGELP